MNYKTSSTPRNQQLFEIKIIDYLTLEFRIDNLIAKVVLSAETLNKGPFGQPLLDYEFFKCAILNLNEGLIEWPNSYAIAIDELEYLMKDGILNIQIT